MRVKPIHNTIVEPTRLDSIPIESQWLSGEGAGSWFCLSPLNTMFQITRYNPQGKIECSGIFKIINDTKFDNNSPYQFTHLSHCKSVNIIQNERVVKMERVS